MPEPQESASSIAAKERRRARIFVERDKRLITMYIGTDDEDRYYTAKDRESRREGLVKLFERALNEFTELRPVRAPHDLRRSA